MVSPRPYHHGDLRRTLLQASIRLIAQVGPDGFTLREVARMAGVSHNAPYRHFRDKESLLAAVASQGFQQLTRSLQEHAARHRRALERFLAAGEGYVEFALRWPQHYAVMFDAPPPRESHPEYAAAATQAFGVLLGHIVECQQEGSFPAGDAHRFALVAWSLVHGIAKLAGTGRLGMKSKSKIMRFSRFAIQSSLRGLVGAR
jgi:AcrR family transcriptional regulator